MNWCTVLLFLSLCARYLLSMQYLVFICLPIISKSFVFEGLFCMCVITTVPDSLFSFQMVSFTLTFCCAGLPNYLSGILYWCLINHFTSLLHFQAINVASPMPQIDFHHDFFLSRFIRFGCKLATNKHTVCTRPLGFAGAIFTKLNHFAVLSLPVSRQKWILTPLARCDQHQSRMKPRASHTALDKLARPL